MTTTSSPVDVVLQSLEARRHGDNVRLLALSDELITFSFNADPDKIGPGATIVGWTGLLQHFQRVAAHWEQLSSDVLSINADAAAPECVHVRIAFKLLHRQHREVLEGIKRQVWTVRDGIVHRVDEIFDTQTLHAFQRYAATVQRERIK